MSTDLFNTVILASSFLLLFTVSEALYHYLHIEAEKTRKLVHLGTGLLTLLFPLLLSNHWYVLLLCASFFGILIVTLHYNLLKSVNKIERVSRGSLLYPVSVYLLFLAFSHYNQLLFFYLPILILAISDPAASLAGTRWPRGKYRVRHETKTLMGSAAFFITAASISIVLISMLTALQFLSVLVISFCVGIFSAFLEAISYKGYDNILIPMAALLVLIVFQNTSTFNLI